MAVAVAVPLIIVGLVLGMSWWLTLLLAVVVGLAAGGFVIYRALAAAVERSLTTFEGATESDHGRLVNLVDGLSLSVGLSDVELFTVQDHALNAAALADGQRSVVVVTTGLLEAVDLMELEGVIAELLVRIKTGDADVATAAASLAQPFIEGPLAGPLGFVGERLLTSALDPDRDQLADQAAVAVTRYPPALGRALDRIAKADPRARTANRRNDHLWLVPPLGDDAVLVPVPLEWRVDMLLEL